MMCENCNQRDASVHFTQVINNKKMEMHLCKQCAKEKGQISFGSSINIDDFLKGVIGISYKTPIINNEPQKLVCSKCGMSYEEFQKIGKFGCSNCYAMYGNGMIPLLKRLHGNVEHHGKVPASHSQSVNNSRELEKLREVLKKAIEQEEYEKAAEIRDKIRSLE